MAITNFANVATEHIAQGINSKEARRIDQTVWKTARRKIDLLRGITALNQLQGEGNKLHDLNKTKPGYHAFKVNDKYRIVFKFEDGNAQDVEVTDYHD